MYHMKHLQIKGGEGRGGEGGAGREEGSGGEEGGEGGGEGGEGGEEGGGEGWGGRRGGRGGGGGGEKSSIKCFILSELNDTSLTATVLSPKATKFDITSFYFYCPIENVFFVL